MMMTMISEAVISNFNQMRMANANGHLCVMASTLQATGEPVHLLAALASAEANMAVIPFGMLAAPTVANGLPEDPNECLRQIQRALSDRTRQAWFQLDAHGRPVVAIAKLGEVPAAEQAQVVLAWDDPYELFSDPTAN